MFQLRTLNKLPFKRCYTLVQVNKLGTKVAQLEKVEEHERQLKEFQKLTKITKKDRPKKPQRDPFAKNLFLGIFDTEMLTYPQLEKDDADALEKNILDTNKFLTHNQIADSKQYNKFFRQNLSDHSLLAMQVSQFEGGREAGASESAQFLESLSRHPLHNNINSNEYLGIQTILKNGSESLQRKYIPQLLDGSSLSGFCLNEPDLLKPDLMHTHAALSPDKTGWILNGEKCMVVDGMEADVYVVFASTQKGHSDENQTGTKITAFLVEKDFGGVTAKREEDSGAVQFATVKFQDTVVPIENIIGTVNEGDQVLRKVITEMRLSRGAVLLSLYKTLFNKTMAYIVTLPEEVAKSELVATKLGELTTNLYGMESALYFTTGLIDWYDRQDIELESAIVKLFCSEATLKASQTCRDIIGAPSVLESHWCSKLCRDIERAALIYESNDSLKMNIALMGLQHTGKNLKEMVMKLRNPAYFPWFTIISDWQDSRHFEDKPRMTLNLYQSVHPSALPAAMNLEYGVLRLKFATKYLLTKYAMEVLNMHGSLRQLAEIVTDAYVMNTSIARASRAYCTGIQSADTEMLTAICLSVDAKIRIKSSVLRLYDFDFMSNDTHFNTISKRLLKFKEYFFKSPLHRNI